MKCANRHKWAGGRSLTFAALKTPPAGYARQSLRQGAASPPLFSGMCRGLVSLFPNRLFLSGYFIFFVVQLLCVILLLLSLSERLLIIFSKTNSPQSMAPFGSRPAAGRRARLR